MICSLRPFSLLICIALFLLLFGNSGCISRRLPAEDSPQPEINWAQETPESLLATMQNRASGLNTFTAYFQISMDPPPAKMPSSFSGILYISKEAENTRLRIKAFHLFGTILFDMVAQDGTTKVFIPSRHTLYVGTTNQEQQKEAQGPQEIFSSLMINFSDLKARPGSSLSIDKKRVKLPLLAGEIWFDKKKGHIISVTQKGKEIVYSDYQKMAANYPAMPTDIRLTTSLGKARCQLKEITLYKTMTDENFDLSHYQVEKVKELSEAGTE